MKKIYSTLVLSALSLAGFSQHQGDVVNAKLRGTIARSHGDGTLRTPTDTLGIGSTTVALNTLPMFAPSSQIYDFGYTGGGWVYGTNISTNNLNECAQGYQYFGNASVEGVVFLAIGKYAGAGHTSASTLNVRLYKMGPTGARFLTGASTWNDVPGPINPVLASGTIAWDDIDTTFGNLNAVIFPSPVMITDEFAVSGEFAAMKAMGDSLGFACDAPGDAGSLDYAFHKVGGTTWYVSNSIFGSSPGALDNNIAIFPVIQDVTGIDGKEGFFQGLKLANYPNPVQSNTTVSYELEKSSSKLTLNVYEISGKNIATYELGAKAAGAYTFDYSAAGLESGNYLFMLKSDSGTLVKKFSVEK